MMSAGDKRIIGLDELAREEERITAEYNERFQPWAYRRVFYAPPAGVWAVDGSFTDGFFESAKRLLTGVIQGELRQGIEGLAAVFLSRHYLELAVKYVLLHSRWLVDDQRNADQPPEVVPNTHNLQMLWSIFKAEVKAKPGVVPKGLDLAFVEAFVKEFNTYDPKNWRFRYPSHQIPAVAASAEKDLGIDYAALLFNLQRTFDILETLDSYLIETHGQNADWEDIQNSWL
jgi:hypothetical protein